MNKELYKGSLERTKAYIEKMKLTPKTRKLIERFDKEHRESLSIATRTNYLNMLRTFLEATKKPLESIGKEDITDFFDRDKHSEGTRNLLKQTIMRFYRWMNGGQEYPEFIKQIKNSVLKIKRSYDNLDPDDLLTPEDVKKLISMVGNERDRAFLSVLYESGGRIGEILSLRIKDVVFDQHGSRVKIEGKTGKRQIRLVDSSLDLRNWLEGHPLKEPERFVFVSLHQGYGSGLTRLWAANLLNVLKKRSGISKKTNPHSWRHARLTELANRGFTEFELKKFAGWRMDSKMARVYIHMSDKDLDDRILKMNGKVPETKVRESPLRNVECVKCGTRNSSVARFCCSCGLALDQESMQRYKETELAREVYRLLLKSQEGEQIIRKVARENPEVREIIEGKT